MNVSLPRKINIRLDHDGEDYLFECDYQPADPECGIRRRYVCIDRTIRLRDGADVSDECWMDNHPGLHARLEQECEERLSGPSDGAD